MDSLRIAMHGAGMIFENNMPKNENFMEKASKIPEMPNIDHLFVVGCNSANNGESYPIR